MTPKNTPAKADIVPFDQSTSRWPDEEVQRVLNQSNKGGHGPWGYIYPSERLIALSHLWAESYRQGLTDTTDTNRFETDEELKRAGAEEIAKKLGEISAEARARLEESVRTREDRPTATTPLPEA
jgi:hypothetical protein